MTNHLTLLKKASVEYHYITSIINQGVKSFSQDNILCDLFVMHTVVTLFVQGSALASHTEDIKATLQYISLKDLFPTLSQFVEGWLQLINSIQNPSLVTTRPGFCQQKSVTLPIRNLEFIITKK